MRRFLFLTMLAGCPDRTISAIDPTQSKVEVKDIPAVPNKKADILFVVDNSGSMAEEQASLRANFGTMMSVLQTLEGGQPDLHVAVVTSDLGTSTTDGTNEGSKFGCVGGGEAGAFRMTPTVSGRFISDDGAGNKNYTGTLEDAFSALADVGVKGCGIEQHLGSIEAGLTNVANTGFMRDDAYLAVVVIGDEDDCSLAHSGLFGSSSDPDTVNYACTADGVECDDTPNDMQTPGVRTKCHPRTTSPKWTQSPQHYADFLKGLKDDPRDVVAAGIVGDITPFAIEKNASNVSILKESCTYSGPTGDQTAFPAVRTASFLEQFTLNSRSTICGADLKPAMTQIGALVKKLLVDPCFDQQLADADPSTPELDPDCQISDVQRVTGGADVELAAIPSCKSAPSALPCWHIDEAPVECSYTDTTPHYKLVIERGGVVPAPNVHVRAQCVTAEPGGSQF
ncbi:MAG: VWA domain-containing protein [Kofleriaceae bacterium]